MSESAQFTSALDHSVSGLKKLIKNHLKFSLARDTQTASRRDWWLATSKAAQSLIIERMIATQSAHHRSQRQTRLLSLARVPHGAPVLQQPLQRRHFR